MVLFWFFHVSVILMCHSFAYGQTVYSVKDQIKLLKKLNATDYQKHITSYKTKDPNFAARPESYYSGILVSEVVKDEKLMPEDIVTFICRDSYLYADTYKNMLAHNSLVANKWDGERILDNFGGPITLVHNVELAKDRYPWYIESIVVGEVQKPSIRFVLEKGLKKRIVWSNLVKTKGNTSKEIVLPSPRGRRLGKTEGNALKAKISYFPLGSIFDNLKNGKMKVKIETFSQKNPAEELSIKEIENYSVAWLRNGKEIPVYEGGPFVVFKEGEPREMKSIFHVLSIAVISGS